MGWSRWSVSHPRSSQKPADRECSNSSPIANYNTLIDNGPAEYAGTVKLPCVTVTLFILKKEKRLWKSSEANGDIISSTKKKHFPTLLFFTRNFPPFFFKLPSEIFLQRHFKSPMIFWFFRQMLITFNTFLFY